MGGVLLSPLGTLLPKASTGTQRSLSWKRRGKCVPAASVVQKRLTPHNFKVFKGGYSLKNFFFQVQSQISMKYGSYTLRSLGPRIWNRLPSEVRNCENLSTFRNLIKAWSGPICHCTSCKYIGMCQ